VIEEITDLKTELKLSSSLRSQVSENIPGKVAICFAATQSLAHLFMYQPVKKMKTP
jgi:hypothetical protein